MRESMIIPDKEKLNALLLQYGQHRSFEGYIWPSGSPEPVVLEGDSLEVAMKKLGRNFIWEMNVYAREDLSLSVRFGGGCWILTETDWKDPETQTADCATYTFHTKGMGEKILRFTEFREPVKSPECEGMVVQTPVGTAFTGFAAKEESDVDR